MSNDQILDDVKYEERVKSLLRRGWMFSDEMWMSAERGPKDMRGDPEFVSFEKACEMEGLL